MNVVIWGKVGAFVVRDVARGRVARVFWWARGKGIGVSGLGGECGGRRSAR